jgi:hypothetical protein
MAFKLTYSDGQETDYDDSTKWEVEDGVVKMGREAGKWTVFVSPSHWATLELVSGKDRDKQDKDQHQGKHEDDEDDEHDEHDEHDEDDEDDDSDKAKGDKDKKKDS